MNRYAFAMVLLAGFARAEESIPYFEAFDHPGWNGPAPGWSTGGTSATVRWKADALPSPVGPGPGGATYRGSAGSLNYNDDTDYEDGTTNEGWAMSPRIGVLDADGLVRVTFRCNHETENGSTEVDRRILYVLDKEGLLAIGGPYVFGQTGDSHPSGTTCQAAGTWHKHSILVPTGLASEVRIWFKFETVNSDHNGFDGWFIDDLYVGCEDTIPPAAPTNLSPADGETIAGGSQMFLKWSEATDSMDCAPGKVDHYRVELRSGAAGGPFVINVWEWPAEEIPIGILPKGVYFWQIWAVDQADNISPGSQMTSFEVDCTDENAPTMPVPLSPADGAIVPGGQSVLLDWADSTDAGTCGPGSVKYRCMLDDEPLFDQPWAGGVVITTASERWTAVLPKGTWYWKITAVDAAGNFSADSPVRSFVVDCDDILPPSSPVQVSPADGNVVAGPTIHLDWTDSPDTGDCGPNLVVEYTFQVAASPLFMNGLEASGFTPASEADVHVDPGTWFWRVRAKDNAGNLGAWSAVKTFTVLER